MLKMNISLHRIFIALILLNFVCTIIGQEIPKLAPFSPLGKPVIGGKISLPCQSLSGSSPLHISWFKDGKELVDSAATRIRTNEDFSTLIVDSISSSHSGNYTCKISNRFGFDSYSTELKIEGPPNWIDKPKSIEISLGKSANIKCFASGYPKPKIQWKKIQGSSWIVLDEFNSINIKIKDEQMMIQKTNPSQMGKYGCFISNGISPDLWTEFEIIVNVPAEFKEKNAVVSVKKGNILELECSPEGDSPVTVKWSKDSTTLDKLDQSRYHVSDQPTQNGLKSVLTVNSADIKDNGLYACLAENSFGKDERNIRVTIIEPPVAPQNFAVQRVWSRSASIAWNKPTDIKTSILGYTIRYWKVASPGTNDRLNEVNITSSISSYLIKDLEPGLHYEASILAINEVGQSQPSRVISFDTAEEEPSAAPVDLHVITRGPTTIRISWKPPQRSTWNGKLLGYYVGYRRADDYKSPYSLRTVHSEEFNGTQDYLLNSLKKSTKYSINVKIFNGAGSGPESNELIIETLPDDVPESPRLYITSTTVDTIAVGYFVPRSDLNKIQNLVLHFKEGDEPIWRKMDLFFDGKESGDYTLTSLNSNTYYMVYLILTNENGASDPSPILKAKTARSQHDSFDIGSGFDFSTERLGGYWDITNVLPLVIAGAIIIIVIVLAFVAVRKAQIEASTKPNFEFCVASQAGTLAYNKSVPVFGTTRRFVDSDNNMPLMHHGSIDNGNQFPIPYDELPVESQRHSKTIDPKHIYDFPR